MGLVLKVDKDFITVLNQFGTQIKVKPQEIRKRLDLKKAVANDRNGLLFSSGDQIEILDGPPFILRKRGSVLFVSRNFVFIRIPGFPENKGVYVTTVSSVALVQARGGSQQQMYGAYTSNRSQSSNSSFHNNSNNSNSNGSFKPRNWNGKRVIICGGPYKGYKGIVKNFSDVMARVELQATSQSVNIEMGKIRLESDTSRQSTFSSSSSWGVSDRSGGTTPWDGGKTPMHSAKTPMYRSSTDGGRTPAWNAGSKTPGYDASASSAWGASSKAPFESSNSYQNALSDTPNNPKTPAMVGSWDAHTPYNQATPGPSYPSMTSVAPETPFVSNYDESQVPESSWVTTDIEVKVIPYSGTKYKDGMFDGLHGVIKTLESLVQVHVRLFNGDSMSIPTHFLEIVRPERRNMVKVIQGEFKNQIGSLISVDGSDGVVKLQAGSEFKVMPMNLLAKHVV